MSKGLTIEDYHGALLDGSTTCAIRVEDELDGIASDYSRKLNAFITLFAGSHGLAMARARTLDSRLRQRVSRELSALYGVPLTIKDNIFFAGFPTSAGSIPFKDFMPPCNAWIIDRVLELGCIPLGKTNLHELALGATSSSAFGGPILNPVDPSRISGGSSGGSAVSVARSRGPLVSLGSDTGGSVRIPAALCGVCGFKPSFGLLEPTGVFPLSATLDHLGILTKSMRDMDTAFSCITDQTVARIRAPIRVAIPKRYFLDRLDEPVAKNFWRAVDRIASRAEFKVKEIEEGEVKEEETAKVYSRQARARVTIQLREAAWFYGNLLLDGRTRKEIHADVAALVGRGMKIGMLGYMQSNLVRQESIATWTRLLRGADALLMPTCPIVAPKVDEVLGKETGPLRPLLLRNTEILNLCGFPALTLPTNFGSAALPTSIQVVGKLRDDARVISIGERIWDALYA